MLEVARHGSPKPYVGNKEIDDLIILRTDGVPTYNFAVVVDDLDMRITHVFRGDEHINNTPWQINIFQALGAPQPRFGHCPIILGDDGLKLSKRRGAVSVTADELIADYRPRPGGGDERRCIVPDEHERDAIAARGDVKLDRT